MSKTNHHSEAVESIADIAKTNPNVDASKASEAIDIRKNLERLGLWVETKYQLDPALGHRSEKRNRNFL